MIRTFVSTNKKHPFGGDHYQLIDGVPYFYGLLSGRRYQSECFTEALLLQAAFEGYYEEVKEDDVVGTCECVPECEVESWMVAAATEWLKQKPSVGGGQVEALAKTIARHYREAMQTVR